MALHKIVIAGGGFGGVRAALELSNFSSDIEITLVNDTPYHIFHADLYELAAVGIDGTKRQDFLDLLSTVNIPFNKIFSGKNVNVLIDKIEKIDLGEKILQTKTKKLGYDYLILTLGSTTSYYNIEGAKEYSHPLKTTADALNINNDLEELLSRKDKPEVVIVGGGFTGVELAGELGAHLKEKINLNLIEASGNLLNGMPGWAQDEALEKLRKLGVNISFSCPIKKVSSHVVVCDKENHSFDYLIWTAGVSGENLDKKIIGVEFDKKGKIVVTPNMNLSNRKEVFVVGDLASVDEVPETAWAAIEEAVVASKNILHLIRSEKLISYIPAFPGFVVAVGGKYALTNIKGFKLKGVVAWLIKRYISLRYLLSILPFTVALSIWWKGVEELNINE